MSDIRTSDSADRRGRPSVCRNCGAIVGAGENVCGQCGSFVAAQIDGAPPRPSRRLSRSEKEAIRFARAIFSRPATFTFLFIIANVFVYLLMTFAGGANGAILIEYGAKLNALVDDGQWWRLVAPIFLHVSAPPFGPAHLLFNMYGLWVLGPYVERLYGSAKFVVFWVVTGVAGVVASYLSVRPEAAFEANPLANFLFKAQDVPSAGASGALFGLIGVLFVFGLKFRHELPEDFKRAFGTGMLPVILINLFIGFVGRGFIDNAAHLGGLVAGVLLALAVGYKRVGPRGPIAVLWHAAQIVALALVVVSFAKVSENYGRSVARLEQVGGDPNRLLFSVETYTQTMGAAQRALVAAYNQGDESQIATSLSEIGRLPNFDAQADQLRDELSFLLRRTRQLNAETQRATQFTPDQLDRREQLGLAISSWNERYNLWLTAEGGAGI